MKDTIYAVRTEKDYEELMEYLEKQGVTWSTGPRPTALRYEPVIDKLYFVDEDNILMQATDSPDVREDFCILDNDIIYWTKSTLPTLAEFLGWKENTIYEVKNKWYKITNGQLLSKPKNSSVGWIYSSKKLNAYDSLINKATEYKPQYRLASIFTGERGTQYLSKNGNDVFFASKLPREELQLFTAEEAEQLIEDFHLKDIVELKRV